MIHTSPQTEYIKLFQAHKICWDMLYYHSPPSTLSLSLSLLQFPVNRFPSSGSPTAPLRKHPATEPSTSHPLKIHPSLRVPGKGAPSMFPDSVPMDTETPSPEPLIYLFMYIYWSPQKVALLPNGENIRSLST